MIENSTAVPEGSAAARAVRVVLADDECLFRASLRQLLSVPPSVIKEVYGVAVGAGFEVVGEAGTGEDALRIIGSARPDLILLDLAMPRMSGLDVLRELNAANDPARAIVLADSIDRSQLLTAVHLGVRGLLLKGSTTEVFFEAMVSVVAGQVWIGQALVTDLLETVRPLIQSSAARGGTLAPALTMRERQILRLIVAGCSNKEIAQQFAVSDQTVKHHLTRMFDKVGASNRLELAMLAMQRGLVDASEPETPIAPPATPTRIQPLAS